MVRGVGYPQPDHSHFRSMDIWQTASPAAPVDTGWLGRWLDATGDDPLRAVSIGSVLPVLAVGARSTAASLPAGPYQPLTGTSAGVVTALGCADPTDGAAAAEVTASCRAERSVAATFTRALGAGSRAPAGHAPSNALADQLGAVATAITAGVPTRAWTVSLGGFDTHSDERQTQQDLWKVVDTAISGFFASLAGHPAAGAVTMLVHSEFGRRVVANAPEGTDHGTAAPVFVIGPQVAGGFHGDQPSLTDLDDGDLMATVDFRAVYGELLGTVLGTDPARVLDTVPRPLGVLR